MGANFIGLALYAQVNVASAQLRQSSMASLRPLGEKRAQERTAKPRLTMNGLTCKDGAEGRITKVQSTGK